MHELNVCPDSDSVATAGATGLPVTDAEKSDVVQETPVVPPGAEANTAAVPLARPAPMTSPTAASVPPTLPTVSTAGESANAGAPTRTASRVAEATAARESDLRMNPPIWTMRPRLWSGR